MPNGEFQKDLPNHTNPCILGCFSAKHRTDGFGDARFRAGWLRRQMLCRALIFTKPYLLVSCWPRDDYFSATTKQTESGARRVFTGGGGEGDLFALCVCGCVCAGFTLFYSCHVRIRFPNNNGRVGFWVGNFFRVCSCFFFKKGKRQGKLLKHLLSDTHSQHMQIADRLLCSHISGLKAQTPRATVPSYILIFI